MELLDKIAKTHPKIVTAGPDETIQVWNVPLSFYPSFSLVGVVVQSQERTRETRYLYNEVEMVFLDGSVSTIMQVNAAENLDLAPHQIAPYLSFFFDYTDDGKLHIVESAEQVTWGEEVSTHADAAERSRQASQLIQPVKVSTQADGGFQAVAVGIFASILVHVAVQVEGSGRIKPLGQRLLMEDLPVARQYPRPRTGYSG